jgi:Carboxypeptidase regulatory-like domain
MRSVTPWARRGLLALAVSGLALAVFVLVAVSVPAARGTASCVDTQPRNVSPPVVSGSTSTGGVLTTTNGTWSYCPPVWYSYQWFRDGSPIAGATASSYTVADADAAAILYAQVTITTLNYEASANSNSVQGATSEDNPATPEADQSDEIGDDTPDDAAAPTPMSPTGAVQPGSYTTVLWTASEMDAGNGLHAVDSTASGTVAFSGIVQDDTTGDPLSGAAVTMSYVPCGTCGAIPATTTTDAQGGFAFINMPATAYTVSVAKSGYGSYTLLNDTYSANETYQSTVDLNTSDQSYDMAGSADKADPAVTPTPPGNAYSHFRVPPSIRVKMYDVWGRSVAGHEFCTRRIPATKPEPVRAYAFDFYLLHVAQGEVNTVGYNLVGSKAFLSIAQNFAWLHKTLPGDWDVNDSRDSQCFRPQEKLQNPNWKRGLPDILDERILWPPSSSNTNLLETFYGSGTFPAQCNDPREPIHGGRASQWGIKARSEQAACLTTDWRDIVKYYYQSGTQVKDVLRPPIPDAHATTSPSTNQITFTYSSTGLAGLNVAWKFLVQKRFVRSDNTTYWRTLYTTRWDSRIRAVRTSITVTRPDGECSRWRVRAGNPAGLSLPGAVNSGATLCV